MRKFLTLLVLLCCITLISGCFKDEPPNEAAKPVQQVQVKPKEKQNLVVYRAAADGSELLLPERIVIEDNGKPAMENALQALVATKPSEAKFADVIPIGTRVLGLKVEKNIAYADFSKELLKQRQGSYEQVMISYAIVNTLTEYPEVKKVQILVEGKKVVSGHMDLEEPLTRNTTLLAKNK